MKKILTLIFIAVSAFVRAAIPESEISSVDAKAGTIVLSTKAGFQTYRLRPDTEILLNGVRGKISDLTAGMAAKITSSEPGVATRVVANGAPGGAAPAADAAGKPAAEAGEEALKKLEERLIGTSWSFEKHKSYVRVDKGGALYVGWAKSSFGKWKVTGENTVEFSPWTDGAKETLKLNASHRAGTITNAQGQVSKTELTGR